MRRFPIRFALALAALGASRCATAGQIHVDAPLLAASSPRPTGCESARIEVYEEGQRSSDPSVQLSRLGQKCQKGNARSCLLLGEMQLAGCGAAPDERAAGQSFERGCDSGEPKACGELGILFSQVGLTPENGERMAKLLSTGCDAGHAGACRHLGLVADRGDGLSADPAMAVEFWERGCSAGDAESCFLAGRAYAGGPANAPRDRDRAALLFGLACNAGHGEACRERDRTSVR